MLAMNVTSAVASAELFVGQFAEASFDKLAFLKFIRREEGIRTLDTLLAYTHFPGVLLRPLGHLSVCLYC